MPKQQICYRSWYRKGFGGKFRGYNSKAGDLTVLRLKLAGIGVDAATLAGAGNVKLHYVLHYDIIIKIRDGGVEVLEWGDKKQKANQT